MSADSRISAFGIALLCGVFAVFRAICSGIALPLCATCLAALLGGILWNVYASPSRQTPIQQTRTETEVKPEIAPDADDRGITQDEEEATCDHFLGPAESFDDTGHDNADASMAAAKRAAHPKAPAPADDSDEPDSSSVEDIKEEIVSDENVVAESISDEDEETREINLAKALQQKEEGNEAFKSGNYEEALDRYTDAIRFCHKKETQHLAALYSNRAACFQHMEDWEAVVRDAGKAIEVKDDFVKAYHRRCKAYEAQNKWQEALSDLNKIIELDPSQKQKMDAHHKVVSQKAAAQFEKEKEEMLGKLKEMGNSVLGYFGMSTDNFQMVQDPNTGSYSVNFKS